MTDENKQPAPASEAVETASEPVFDNSKESVEVKKADDAVITDEPLVASELVPKGEKLLATLGYFGPLCILPLALKPKSKLCQMHGKQALVIFIVFLIFSWLGWLSGALAALLNIIQVGISIWGMANAWRGKEKYMPFFGEIASKLNW